MSTGRWMDKEDVVYIYSGMLFSHKKEWNNALWNNMDETRDRHTKTERERKISYNITYMWNLKKKWYKWIYLQSRIRLTDIENKCIVTKKERSEAGIN